MCKIWPVFFLMFFSCLPAFCGQPSGTTLVKTGIPGQTLNVGKNPGSVSFQWIASNNTPVSGDYFINEIVPEGCVFQSVRPEGFTIPSLNMKPSLPLSGPANLLIGPFPLAVGGSVTFKVSEVLQADLPRSGPKALVGESFALVSKAQLSGKKTQLSADAETLSQQAETPTDKLTPVRDSIESFVAVPNVSRTGQPIHFRANLESPALITLTLYALTGEKVYSLQAQGSAGSNELDWNLQNSAGQSVASGLYVYFLEINTGNRLESKTGKVAVIR